MRCVKYPDGKKIRLYASVGRSLHSHRMKAGHSLKDLASMTGIARSQLSKIEEGQACPLHILVTLADVYDVTLDDLVPVLTDVRAA